MSELCPGILKRLADPPLEVGVLRQHRLEACLLLRPVDCAKQVRELRADRGLGFAVEHQPLKGDAANQPSRC